MQHTSDPCCQSQAGSRVSTPDILHNVNSVSTSDRLDDVKAANVAFVVTRSAVAATMDMGVGHSGLGKLCRYLDLAPPHHSTYLHEDHHAG